jgi:hypothetical protein
MTRQGLIRISATGLSIAALVLVLMSGIPIVFADSPTTPRHQVADSDVSRIETSTGPDSIGLSADSMIKNHNRTTEKPAAVTIKEYTAISTKAVNPVPLLAMLALAAITLFTVVRGRTGIMQRR